MVWVAFPGQSWQKFLLRHVEICSAYKWRDYSTAIETGVRMPHSAKPRTKALVNCELVRRGAQALGSEGLGWNSSSNFARYDFEQMALLFCLIHTDSMKHLSLLYANLANSAWVSSQSTLLFLCPWWVQIPRIDCFVSVWCQVDSVCYVARLGPGKELGMCKISASTMTQEGISVHRTSLLAGHHFLSPERRSRSMTSILTLYVWAVCYSATQMIPKVQTWSCPWLM